jgi:hypothetical protein
MPGRIDEGGREPIRHRAGDVAAGASARAAHSAATTPDHDD